MRIEPYQPEHLDAIARLALRAWAPVFDSLQKVMDPDVYREFFPDWRVSQKKAVEKACNSDEMKVWVAVESGSITGFIAFKFISESRMGEIYMVAVDPEFQRQGIGTALMEFAVAKMKTAGMSIAMVETGGDPGHAPARQTYERTGFKPLHVVRYFKKL